ISVAVDPTGRFAYVANNGSANVSTYTVNTTSGVLTSMGAPVAAGSGPFSVAVDPSGEFAYVLNNSADNISLYSIDASTGALSSAGMRSAGLNPAYIAIVGGNKPVTRTPKFAYVTNFTTNDISGYVIDPTTGALTSVGPAVAAGSNPASVAVDPSGRF